MTRTVTLTDEAYTLLKSMTRKGESFSDTIKRLSKKGELTEILDLYPELREVEEFEEAIRENRKALDDRMQ